MNSQSAYKRKLITLMWLSAAALLVACTPGSQETQVADTHTSQNALDWAGVYAGTVPCASCSGIKTRLVLHSDGHYSKESHYLDNPGVFTEQGQIQWDDQGRNISLISDKEDEASHYWVVENALVQLDQQQQKITGDLAGHYRLEKVRMQLTQQTWQLTSITNEKVTDKLSQRVNIRFDAEGKVSGQAPCNRYFATWQQNDRQLSIEKVGATKMACSYLQQEQAFFAQLAKVDNYEIKQTILLLKQGDEILLSFKAAFEPKQAKD